MYISKLYNFFFFARNLFLAMDSLQYVHKAVSKKRKNTWFMHNHGENICFLASCAARKNPKNQKWASGILEMVMPFVSPHEPTILLANEMCGINIEEVKITGYSDFEECMESNCISQITNAMVQETLAYFSNYHLPPTLIVERVWARIQKMATFSLCYRKNNTLTKKSEDWIYLWTHFLLSATIYNYYAIDTLSSLVDWNYVYCLLKNWLKELESKKDQNLEIWLELIFCLLLYKDDSCRSSCDDSCRSFCEDSVLALIPKSLAHFKNIPAACHAHLLFALIQETISIKSQSMKFKSITLVDSKQPLKHEQNCQT
jgi:hypothetical protein